MDRISQVKGLAVFDCDGTLVDSQHTIVSCMQSAFEAHGFSVPTPLQIRRIVGLPLDVAIAELAVDATADQVDLLCDGYKTAFRASRMRENVHEPLYQGTVEALDALERNGWMMAVATGKSHRGLTDTLMQHNLLDRFVSLQTSDRARGKPDPEMLTNAMADAGVGTAETVMIGDTTFDIMMARNAGVTAIGVDWGYHEVDELHAAGAAEVATSYSEIPALVAELMEASK